MRTINILFLSISTLLFACKEDETTFEHKGEEVTAYLNLKGEVGTTDIPMGGRINTTDDYIIYGIQVDAIAANGSYIPYAIGVYDDVSKVQLALIEGNAYHIVATAFQRGTAYGLSQFAEWETKELYFDYPISAPLTNNFIYSNEQYYSYDAEFVSYYPDLDSVFSREVFTQRSIDGFLKR